MVNNLRSEGQNSRADYLEMMQQVIDALLAGDGDGDVPKNVLDYRDLLAKSNIERESLVKLIEAVNPIVDTRIKQFLISGQFDDDTPVRIEIQATDGPALTINVGKLVELWKAHSVAVHTRNW